MGQKFTEGDYEIRFLSQTAIKELVKILEFTSDWEKLMSIIPTEDNRNKYTDEHIRMIRNAGSKSGRDCTEILLAEWGTSGRKRPRLSTLLHLLQQAHLLRAADYISRHLLNRYEPVERPVDGPAARIPIPDLAEELTAKATLVPSSASLQCNTISPYQLNQTIPVSNFIGGQKVFTYEELSKQSDGFSVCLGSGAFGTVYLCDLPTGKVAVKRLHPNPMISNTGHSINHFQNEILALTRFQHKNLLPLAGCSCDGPFVCLVYNYMPNGSLEDKLRYKGSQDVLNWETRLSICQGSARGLLHLHSSGSQALIHRDVKSANILLDADMTPKLGDFGLSRMGPVIGSGEMTSNVAGTSPYMAPEAFRGNVSPKMDVYSFGVVLLEVITGLRAFDEERECQDLVSYVEEVEDIKPLIDTKPAEADNTLALSLYEIAESCLLDLKRRPKMVSVVEKLDSLTLSH